MLCFEFLICNVVIFDGFYYWCCVWVITWCKLVEFANDLNFDYRLTSVYLSGVLINPKFYLVRSFMLPYDCIMQELIAFFRCNNLSLWPFQNCEYFTSSCDLHRIYQMRNDSLISTLQVVLPSPADSWLCFNLCWFELLHCWHTLYSRIFLFFFNY